MKLLKNNVFSVKSKTIRIIPFGDWHLGAEYSDMSLIKEAIHEVKTDPDCYAIGIGDLMDMVTYQSKGLIHTQKLLGTDQVKTLMNLLKPIRHKIIFMLTGNHEHRTIKNSAVDLTELVCASLDIPYKEFECLFGIRFYDDYKNKSGSKLLHCYAHHNSGGSGGSTKGGKHNKLMNLHWSSPFADLILGGHTHGHTNDYVEIWYLDRSGVQRRKIQHLVCTGTALKSGEKYSRQNAMHPAPIGFPIIEIKLLQGQVKEFEITIKRVIK